MGKKTCNWARAENVGLFSGWNKQTLLSNTKWYITTLGTSLGMSRGSPQPLAAKHLLKMEQRILTYMSIHMNITGG